MTPPLDEQAKVQLLHDAFAKKQHKRLELMLETLLANAPEYKISNELVVSFRLFAWKKNNFISFLSAYKKAPIPSNLVKPLLAEGCLFLDKPTNKFVMIVAQGSRKNRLLCLDESGHWLDISKTDFCKRYPKIIYIRAFSWANVADEFAFKLHLFSLSQRVDKNIKKNDKKKITDFYKRCMQYPFYVVTGIYLEVAAKLLSKLELPILLSRVYMQESELAFLLECTQTQVRYLDNAGHLKQCAIAEFIAQRWVAVADRGLISNNDPYHTAKTLDGLSAGYIRGVNAKHSNKSKLYQRDGVLLLRGVFAKKTINNLRKNIVPQLDKLKQMSMSVGHNRRLFALDIKGLLNEESIYFNHQLQDILTEQLSPSLVINSVILVAAKKDSYYQHVHADHPSLFFQNDDMPAHATVLAIPLVAANQQTGSTRLVCATNDGRSNYQKTLFSQRKTVNTNVGDCYIYDYRVMHQGTPTLVDQLRPVLFIVYSRPWFREMVKYKQLMQCFMSDEEFNKVPFQHHSLFLHRNKSFNGEKERE